MKEVLVCALMFIYCLIAGWLMLAPTLADSNKHVLAAHTEEIHKVVYANNSELPDPNQILALVNEQRTEAGNPILAANNKLANIAVKRADDMANNRYYAHLNTEGKYYYDLMLAKGIKVGYSCENLEMAIVTDVNTYINDWMSSTKGHRECMLNANVTQAGYAVSKMTTTDFSSNDPAVYLVVAIHSTDLE